MSTDSVRTNRCIVAQLVLRERSARECAKCAKIASFIAGCTERRNGPPPYRHNRSRYYADSFGFFVRCLLQNKYRQSRACVRACGGEKPWTLTGVPIAYLPCSHRAAAAAARCLSLVASSDYLYQMSNGDTAVLVTISLTAVIYL